jgi:hypothetical protein
MNALKRAQDWIIMLTAYSALLFAAWIVEQQRMVIQNEVKQNVETAELVIDRTCYGQAS